MATTLTPTVLTPDNAALDLSTLVATPANATLNFSNTGREILVLQATAGSKTATVSIGTTILGQAVTSFSAISLTSGDVQLIGPFHSQVDAPGTATVTVTLTDTTTKVALIQIPGVV